jgi:type IV pilus assembly protein PilQ
MRKALILLALAVCAPLRSIAQDAPPPDSGNPSTEQPPQPQQPSPPPPVIEQPPPPAGGNPYPYPPSTPPNRRPSNLGDQERELLDKHRENAARGTRALSAKGAKKSAVEKALLARAATPKAGDGMLNVDYVDEPIMDVLRAIATAFKLSIIPDKDLGDVKVTIHLENIPVLEGLDKLCKSHGLELTADGNVYRVRKTKETAFSLIEVRNKRMNLDVQNRPVKEFLREFVEKTRINIVPGQDLRGLVTGHLKEVEPIDGFKALMDANNYEVRLKNGVYLVENGDSVGGQAQGYPRGRRNQGYPNPSTGSSDVDVHDGRVTLSLNNASLGDAIREIAEQAGLNFTIIGDVTGNVNAQLKGLTVDEALSALLQGTRYAYLRRDGTLLIGDRNPNTPSGQALSGADLVYLRYIKAENIEKILPKSLSADNIKVIKEQNAVLISGTGDDIAQIKSFLEKVDIPTPQVLMEVVVVEYNRNKNSELGLGTGPSAYTGVAANIQGNMSGVRQTFSKGSFQGVIGILPPKFDLNLRALESKNKAKILSMPKITTLNGNKADLKVSRTSYYPVRSVTKDGFQNNDFRTIDDGITIELTPWITKHGEVNVTISPSIKTSEQAVGDTPPPVTNRSINTNVTLMDGETIALGGLINSKEDNTREFVPILGSIPVLGYLFSWRNLHTFTTELVIYVTPHILNPDSQSVNLEDEFESLDKRSGFLENSDFIKGAKEGAIKNSAKAQEKQEKAASSDNSKTDSSKTRAKPAAKSQTGAQAFPSPAPAGMTAPPANTAKPANAAPARPPTVPPTPMPVRPDTTHRR